MHKKRDLAHAERGTEYIQAVQCFFSRVCPAPLFLTYGDVLQSGFFFVDVESANILEGEILLHRRPIEPFICLAGYIVLSGLFY